MLRGLTTPSFYSASISLQHIKDQINISGIRETLRKTSEDIDHEIVHNVLHTISLQCEPRANLARRILALLTAAKEPMTAEALCHALGVSYVVEPHRLLQELEKEFIPGVGELVKCCKGLITIDPVTRLVTLVPDDMAKCMRRHRRAHLSDNLTGMCPKTHHFSSQEMTMLTAVSLGYLSMSIFEEGPCHQIDALRQRLDEYPFLDYAAHHWGYHARELMVLGGRYSATEYAVNQLLRKARSLESVFQVRDLDADVVRLLEAPQKGKGHDRALDATQIRSGISTLQVLSGSGLTSMVINLLADNPATSFEPDSFGTSALHEAARVGSDRIVDILLRDGADPFSLDRNGKSPLYYAARYGGDNVISELRDTKKMPITSYELYLAFFEAIEAGNTHVVLRLLKHVAKNATTKTSTILISIRAGHLNILEILLDQGADLSCPDLLPSDQIPLHQAIKHGRADMAKLLLDRGADVHARDTKKRNAIFETLKAPNTDGLSLLLDRGILVNCRDWAGNSVLHQAAVDGRVEHARLLIDQDMIPTNAFNYDGLTPLHLAVRANQFEIAEMLLKCEGVDVNIEATAGGGIAGWTPLMYAVVAGSLRLCDMLIQKGADVEGASLRTTLMRVRKGDDEIRDLLVSACDRPRQVSMREAEA